ncbi:hypothetical protein [Hyunsoonleella pacifica]|uniref:Uncharacterized protein n=1 Tax=Hyunsoonleella pacifica TaxID=1080224 RepID=A0A4Q9FL63_9FLAO|nr:hypothetical protein [Hyunsoonleella pacifica]TBN13829.1 hypothetical protein EYD46_15145 [Hyunsoonleella pacifica]GGD26038.1 hypothetical protein GCM10011368_30050 [Hyunsoonleella pacifica]
MKRNSSIFIIEASVDIVIPVEMGILYLKTKNLTIREEKDFSIIRKSLPIFAPPLNSYAHKIT